MKNIPIIGQPWPEQGGIYIGTRLINGVVRHRIIPGGTEFDIQVSYDNAATRIKKARGRINGFADWRHGDQRDLMLAYINVPHLFHQSGVESIQISSTPFGSNSALAVDFEDGFTYHYRRRSELPTRPFRSATFYRRRVK